MNILTLPITWQNYIIDLERALDKANFAWSLLAAVAILELVLLVIMRVAQSRKAKAASVSASCVLTNALSVVMNQMMRSGGVITEDLDRGIVVIDNTVVISAGPGASPGPFTSGPDIRAAIIDDTLRGEGAAFMMSLAPPLVVFMTRESVIAWRSSLPTNVCSAPRPKQTSIFSDGAGLAL